MERPDIEHQVDIQAGRRAGQLFQSVTLGEGARRRHREQLAKRMAGGVLEERQRRGGELALISGVLVLILAVTIWQYAGLRDGSDIATVPADTAATAASVEPAELIRVGELSLDAEGRTRRVLQIVIPSPSPTEGTVAALAGEAARFLDETGADVVAVLAWRDESEVGDPEQVIGRAYVSSDGEGWGEPDAVHDTFQDDQGGILVELFLWPNGQRSPDGSLTSVRVVPKPE